MPDVILTVDDIVTGKVAEELGPGIIPTRAILIVETIATNEEGDTVQGMRYLLSEGTRTWQAMGPLRATLLKLEHDDLIGWVDDDDPSL